MTTQSYGSNDLVPKIVDGSYELTEGIPPDTDHHGGPRRFEHAGHVVEIHTSYRIVIDGAEYPETLHAMQDGSVHYHGLPQYSSPSAVDLVKVIVSQLREGDTPAPIGEPAPEDGHGGGH